MALRRDERRARPEEGVVDRVAWLRVVADGDLGEQHRADPCSPPWSRPRGRGPPRPPRAGRRLEACRPGGRGPRPPRPNGGRRDPRRGPATDGAKDPRGQRAGRSWKNPPRIKSQTRTHRERGRFGVLSGIAPALARPTGGWGLIASASRCRAWRLASCCSSRRLARGCRGRSCHPLPARCDGRPLSRYRRSTHMGSRAPGPSPGRLGTRSRSLSRRACRGWRHDAPASLAREASSESARCSSGSRTRRMGASPHLFPRPDVSGCYASG